MAPFAGQTAVVIPLYFVSAGILLFAAYQSALVALAGHRRGVQLAFAATCLCAAVFQVATARLYLAVTVQDATGPLRWQGAALIIFHPLFILFTASYSDQRLSRRWLAAVTLFFGGVLVATLLSPFGIRWTTAHLATPIELPWGERLTLLRGETGWLSLVARVANLSMLVWALFRARAMLRAGRRRSALLFGGCVVLFILTAAWGLGVDRGWISGLYVPGFGFLALAVLMGISLGLDLRQGTDELRASTVRLAGEVALRRSAELQIRSLAYDDPLTGLANRAQLLDHLLGALAQAGTAGRGGAMILIDLDHFKTINEGLTHEVGDAVLCEVAGRVLGASDGTFVARVGGDEFALVLADLPARADEADDQVRAAAEAVLARLVGPLRVGARIIDVGASAGMVRFPQDAASVADILRRADMALSQAKSLGRNNVQFYHPALQAAADARMELERGLRAALGEGRLELRFQPQVTAAGGVLGAEVLLRWRHPELGEVSPARFIPIAEETGLIHALGDWVLDTACDRLVEWNRERAVFSGRLSVNVSGWQLVRPDYVERVLRTLSERGLSTASLTLEVTESTFLSHMEEAAAKLRQLRAAGIRIALDDFGTGYSSLAYLHHLPLDEIKIDRAFVRQVHGRERHPLVETIVAIGHHMHLDVIAEGVELESQRAALLAAGCGLFQGYLFSRPLAEADFLEWLAEQPSQAEDADEDLGEILNR